MARPDREAEVSHLPLAFESGFTAEQALRAGVKLAIVVAAAFLVVRLARRGIPRAVGRLSDSGGAQRVETLTGLLLSVTTVTSYGLAAITGLGLVGIPLGPLLASAGVVGLAVGFGAQQLVRDVISGFFVLVEAQYAVGDTITAGGVTGTVEALTLRLTRIRGEDGVLHHVRNGDLGVVSNASRGYAVATVQVPLDADADPVAATDAVRAAVASLVERGDIDGQLLADPVVLGVTEVRADRTPVLTITARTRPDARSAVSRILLREATAALRPRPAGRRSGSAAPGR